MRNYSYFQIFKEIDLFGKEPDLYYKGKQRKTTWMGRICTWIYIFIYIFFLIYKLVRMFKRLDVSFSETNSSTGGLPKIHLNKELFTYGLALSDDYGFPIYDETIYFPEAFLVGKRTINGIPQPIYAPIDFGICDINDFGKNFQQFTTSLDLKKYYCFKNLDIDFEGYTSAENFTSILINIKRCKIKDKYGNPCKDDTIIDSALNGKNLIIFSEDFELVPYNYKKPVKEKFTVNNCPIRLDQLQTFVGYYQLVDIQTENNLFGFEAFSNIKSEKYIIYHSALIMAYQNFPGMQEVMTYNIMLKENTLTNRRTYTQFIDVLGDVGGLMEVVESVFGVMCLLVADILYDKTMVNNLFSFDLNSYSIRVKNKLKNKIIVNDVKILNLNNKNDNNIHNNGIYNNNLVNSDKKIIEISKNNTIKKDKPSSNKAKLQAKKTFNPADNNSNININSSERSSYLKKSTIKIPKKSIFEPKIKNEDYNGAELNIEDVKIYDNEKQITDKIINPKRLIKKIDTNIFCTYFCFCCVRKRQNFGNVLLDEAMDIITDKLDIYNMFRNFYFIDDIKAKWNYEYKDFEMSEECKNRLKDVSHKIIDSFYRL
jgi:hypothetical protein